MLPTSPVAFMARYVRRRPWHFAALGLLITGATGCAVAAQYGMKLIVDEMAVGDRLSSRIWQSFALFLGLIASESILSRVAGWLGCLTIVQTGVDVRLDLFRHLAGHPMQFFARHMSGAIGGRVTATAGALAGALGSLAWHVMPPCIDFLGAIIVLLTIDRRIAFALLAGAALVAVLITAFGSRGRSLHRAYAREGSSVNGELIDTVANMWTVKAFSSAEREFRRLRRAIGQEATSQRQSWLYTEKARMLHDVCLWILAGGMLFWALYGWRIGRHSPGDVVVISALTFRILNGSRDLGMSLVGVAQQTGVVGEMLQVIGGRHAVADLPGAVPFRPGPGTISVQRMTYGHDPDRPLFVNLDVVIPGGQRVGIVGPSGAGKSTLIGLIQRLDDVHSGQILIDGQRISDLQQNNLRDAIAVVPQEIALFHRSVLANIRYGRPDASLEEVRDAARAARCHDFIQMLPEGYDTKVGERGVMLSGGQRQRIGIARAFLKDAPILLLDEATSSLDSASEQDIRIALDGLMQGRTVVAVAHRLATVASFDRILVMVDGAIVEDGSPDQLRTAGGMFERLWVLQAQGADTELA